MVVMYYGLLPRQSRGVLLAGVATGRVGIVDVEITTGRQLAVRQVVLKHVKSRAAITRSYDYRLYGGL